MGIEAGLSRWRLAALQALLDLDEPVRDDPRRAPEVVIRGAPVSLEVEALGRRARIGHIDEQWCRRWSRQIAATATEPGAPRRGGDGVQDRLTKFERVGRDGEPNPAADTRSVTRQGSVPANHGLHVLIALVKEPDDRHELWSCVSESRTGRIGRCRRAQATYNRIAPCAAGGIGNRVSAVRRYHDIRGAAHEELLRPRRYGWRSRGSRARTTGRTGKVGIRHAEH